MVNTILPKYLPLLQKHKIYQTNHKSGGDRKKYINQHKPTINRTKLNKEHQDKENK